MDPLNDAAKQIRRIQEALTSARTEIEKDRALEEFARLGKSLSADDMKAIIACGCGPSGERGIESWPCVV
jgi:hypothetical protein